MPKDPNTEVVEQDTTPEPAFDIDAVAAKIDDDQFAAAFGEEVEEVEEIESDEVEVEVDEAEGEEVEVEVEKDDDENDDLEDDDSEEELEEEAAAKVDPDAPTLPDTYRRSLKAYGWSDKEIDHNLSTLKGDFVKTAQMLHKNRREEVAAWANAGRAAKAQGGDNANQNLQVNAPATPVAGLKPVDMKALKEKYGEDGLIDEIAGPMNAMIAAVNSVLPILNQGVQQTQQTAQDQLQKIVTDFYAGESLKPYAKLYGDGKTRLTVEQLESRNNMLEQADALMLGAKQMGRNLTVDEALHMAHDIVSSDFRETAARESIKKVAKNRSRGRTQRPSGRRKGTGSNGQLSDSELESKVGEGLKKVFG